MIDESTQFTILIAEDDRTIRQMIAHAMHRDGYRVLEASDGGQALALYDTETPDLVLLDAMMPVMDGIEVCQRIASIPVSVPVPILIVTSLDNPATINRAFEAGAIDYLTKPINWHVLHHRARYLLHSRRIELAHHISKQRYKALFAQTNDGVFFLDFNGICTNVNQRGAVMLGYAVKELVGMHTSQFAQPYNVAENMSYWQAMLAGETVPIYEEFFMSKEGDKFPVEINLGLAYDLNGKPAHVQVIARDITERRQLETTRAEFIGVTSHELRTPLTSLLGFLQTMKDGKTGPLTEIQHEFVTMSYDSGRQLANLVNDLLDITQLESGKLAIHMELTDLKILLQRALQRHQPTATKQQVLVEIQLPESSVLTVEADHIRLAQILDNLLSNALKFTPPHGKVRLTLQETSPGAEINGQTRQNAGFKIKVADTGLGVPVDDLPHLFSRFYRAANVTQKAIEGSGLGLYITKGLIESHQGCIWVESQENVGTSFYVWLPVRQVRTAGVTNATAR